MADPEFTDQEPGPRTWVLGALLVIAIVSFVFFMIARHEGSTNDTLPRATIPASSMVASL